MQFISTNTNDEEIFIFLLSISFLKLYAKIFDNVDIKVKKSNDYVIMAK